MLYAVMIMLITVIRTIILYTVVIFSLRIMGKRQIGELQPSELVAAIMISDLATVPMSSVNMPLLSGIIPVFTLIIAEVLISFVGLKSRSFRKLISGTPSVVIYDGKISENELERMRFNLDDLLEELRLNNYSSIADVQVAVLETSGKLSIIPKDSARTVTVSDMELKNIRHDGLPFVIVTDGILNEYELKRSGKTLEFINAVIKNHGANRIKDVLILSIDIEGGIYIQLKERLLKQRKNNGKERI